LKKCVLGGRKREEMKETKKNERDSKKNINEMEEKRREKRRKENKKREEKRTEETRSEQILSNSTFFVHHVDTIHGTCGEPRSSLCLFFFLLFSLFLLFLFSLSFNLFPKLKNNKQMRKQ
jgi:predicted membrane channel-forming protein YqfA (hemolysin III family)